MKAKYFAFGQLTLVAGLLFACSGPEKHSQRNINKEQIEKDVLPIVQSYVNKQYDYLIRDGASWAWQEFAETKESNDTIGSLIQDYKSKAQQLQFRYTAYNSKLTIDSFKKDNSKLTLFVTDRYSLVTNDHEPSDSAKFITTEGLYNYKISMINKENKWLVSDFITSGDDRFHIGLQKTNTNSTNSLKKNSSSPALATASYNYMPDVARDYAYVNYLNGNPDYCDYSSKGGDCTNFLSQCLNAGGWTQNSQWQSKTRADCPTCRNWFPQCTIQDCFTCSWTVAQGFHDYVINSNRIENGTFPDDQLNVGDILQFGNSPSSIVHSSIVTKKTVSGGVTRIYVTYRNSSAGNPAKDRLSAEIVFAAHHGFKVKASGN
jgi:hypothetical protein